MSIKTNIDLALADEPNFYTFNISDKSGQSLIDSIDKDDIFVAKTTDKEIITDDEGNSLFKALDKPKFELPIGWYVSCVPVKDDALIKKLLKED